VVTSHAYVLTSYYWLINYRHASKKETCSTLSGLNFIQFDRKFGYMHCRCIKQQNFTLNLLREITCLLHSPVSGLNSMENRRSLYTQDYATANKMQQCRVI